MGTAPGVTAADKVLSTAILNRSVYMSATTQRSAVVGEAAGTRISGRRLSTETKAAFKTTEFMAYIAVLVGLFIAGAVTSGGVDRSGVHHADALPAHQVWLYASVLTVGYMISRGLAKSGTKYAGGEDPLNHNR